MIRRIAFWIVLLLAVALGLFIAAIDARTTWDDTGMTAMAILVLTTVLAAAFPRRPWIWALAVGVWIPLSGIVRHQNYGSILALAVAFVGAYVGVLVRRMIVGSFSRTGP